MSNIGTENLDNINNIKKDLAYEFLSRAANSLLQQVVSFQVELEIKQKQILELQEQIKALNQDLAVSKN